MTETPFSPNKDILPPAQKELWPELRQACKMGFVLYGGTAIALRLGHRVSVDFDLFTEKSLEREKLKEAFPFLGRSTVLQDEKNSLSVVTSSPQGNSGPVKVSFFGGIGFGRVGIPELTRDGVLQVASLDDLMATKVKTILQRVSAKDYTDIAAMVEAGVSLARGLAAAREMFGESFQPSESLKAMIYFKGGDLHLLSPETKETLAKAVSDIRELPRIKLAARTLGPAEVNFRQRGEIGLCL
jgi:hypothetical protein